MHKLWLMAGLSFVALLSNAARAQDWMTAPPAPTVTKVHVGRATVSLPPGNWQEIAVESGVPYMLGGGTVGGRTETKLYATYDNGRLAGTILVNSNSNTEVRYLTPPACARTDVLFTDNTSVTANSYDCLLINHAVTNDPSLDKGVFASRDQVALAHGGIPTVWLQATFNMVGQTQNDYLTVVVSRNIRLDGFNESKSGWVQSPWHRSNITADRLAVAQRLFAWAKLYRVTLRRDFRDE